MAKEKKLELELPEVKKEAVKKPEVEKKVIEKEEDKMPEWYTEEKTVLVRDKGILKVLVDIEDIKRELKGKKNWDYRLTDKSEKYLLIDYEKDEARFYVKALLAKVNKLKEVKMLWMVIFTLLLFFLVYIGTFVILNMRMNDLQKAMAAMTSKPAAASVTVQPQGSSVIENPFNELGGAGRPVNPPASASGAQQPINNHLFE